MDLVTRTDGLSPCVPCMWSCSPAIHPARFLALHSLKRSRHTKKLFVTKFSRTFLLLFASRRVAYKEREKTKKQK